MPVASAIATARCVAASSASTGRASAKYASEPRPSATIRSAVICTMAASSQCIIISTPFSRAACIVWTNPGARASKVGRTMNTLMVVCPASTSAASESAVALAGSETMGWKMTSAMDCACISGRARASVSAGVSPSATPPKLEMVVMPPASAAREPEV